MTPTAPKFHFIRAFLPKKRDSTVLFFCTTFCALHFINRHVQYLRRTGIILIAFEMNVLDCFFVFFLFFFVFSLGLNLGLYGVISFDGWHQTNGKDYSRGIFQKHDVNQWSHLQLSSTQEENQGEENTVELVVLNKLEVKTFTGEQERLTEALADPMQYDSLILNALTSHQYKLPPTLREVLVTAEKRYTSTQVGPIESYLQMDGRFPIALLTCNRAKSLEQTIGILTISYYRITQF